MVSATDVQGEAGRREGGGGYEPAIDGRKRGKKGREERARREKEGDGREGEERGTGGARNVAESGGAERRGREGAEEEKESIGERERERERTRGEEEGMPSQGGREAGEQERGAKKICGEAMEATGEGKGGMRGGIVREVSNA